MRCNSSEIRKARCLSEILNEVQPPPIPSASEDETEDILNWGQEAQQLRSGDPVYHSNANKLTLRPASTSSTDAEAASTAAEDAESLVVLPLLTQASYTSSETTLTSSRTTLPTGKGTKIKEAYRLESEGGFSLDSRSAGKEPKIQNWVF